MQGTLSSLSYHPPAEGCLNSVQVWSPVNTAARNFYVKVLHRHKFSVQLIKDHGTQSHG